MGVGRRPWATLALAVTSLAVALGVCELAVRLLGRAPTVYRAGFRAAKSAYRLSDDPILGYELKPGYRDPEADCTTSFPAINADGQRDLERTVAKPPGTTRILVLGDSVALGLNLPELDDLISRQLEQAFARPDVEVLNFAVMGYNTRGEVELLERKGLRYAPDVVVVVFLDNDYMENNGDNYPCTRDRPAFLNALFLHSALFRMASLRLDLFDFGLEVDPHYTSKREKAALTADHARRGVTHPDHVGDAIELLGALGRAHGFRSLIAVWPTFEDDGIIDRPVLFSPGDTEHLTIEGPAGRAGIPVVRLSTAFRADYERRAVGGATGPRELYTFDAVHPKPIGTRVAAAAIRDALVATPGLLPESRRPE